MVTEAFEFAVSPSISLRADRYGPAHGAPVLLLHGSGQTRWSWEQTARSIGQQADGGMAIYAVDLRGHGDSAWCPDGDYRIDMFAADVRAMVGALDAPPVIVGASMGGLAALLACGELPHAACAGIVLVDIAPLIELKGSNRVGGFMRKTLDGFASLDEAAAAIAAYSGRARDGRKEGLLKNLRQGNDGRYRWHWDPAVMARRDDDPEFDVFQARLVAATEAITAPILIVRGGDSDVLSRETMVRLREILPQIKQVEIPGARHMIVGDDNAKFFSAIMPFLVAHTRKV
jgi:pimeloyl-ACP methyl ester carboxylesterase